MVERPGDLRCYGVGGCDVPDARGRPTDRQAPSSVYISRHARVHRPVKGSRRLRRMGPRVRKLVSLVNSPFARRRLTFSPFTSEREIERTICTRSPDCLQLGPCQEATLNLTSRTPPLAMQSRSDQLGLYIRQKTLILILKKKSFDR